MRPRARKAERLYIPLPPLVTRGRRRFSLERSPLDFLSDDPAVRALADALALGRRAVASGSVGSSTIHIARAVATLARRPVVLVLAHLDDADDAAEELAALGVDVLRFPALEALPGEAGASIELAAERLAVARATPLLTHTPGGSVLIAPVQALMQGVPPPARLATLTRTLETGSNAAPAELIRWLDGAGYRRVEAVEEPGDYAARGGIIDIFAPGSGGESPGPAGPIVSGAAARLDFFGDTIERISEIDLESMGSDRTLGGVRLVCADPAAAGPGDDAVNLIDLLPAGCVTLLAETMEIVEQARGYYERLRDSKGMFGPPAVLRLLESRSHALAEVNHFSAGGASADVRIELPVLPLPTFSRDASEAVRELGAFAAARAGPTYVACRKDAERSRLLELLSACEPTPSLMPIVADVTRGFAWGDGIDRSRSVAVVPYHELLGRFTTRRRTARVGASRAMDTFLDLQAGDYVVHTEHGIARFAGLAQLKPRELPGANRATLPGERPAQRPSGDDLEEFLTLEFAGRSKLYVPVTQIDLVQKYVGGFGGKPPLSVLGGEKWRNQKARVADSVRDLAAELLRVRAARGHMPGIAYPPDTPWQREFEAEFPYTETEDQLVALAAIKKDMNAARPMDRLICGDVGFGKTELAIRAAFKACEFGKQVAVLVPTTILAEQHERTFRSRFADYPFRVESLSRLKSGRDASQILGEVRAGRVDVLIGTHRLLSEDVRFADLGLVIVDEEQRFGVEHKERLLRLKMTVDVLTLSATPIPRTLHMSLLGLRDISNLTTAPLDRRAIVTEVAPYNPARIKQAIDRELSREGQIFFVHNRISDIRSVADDVRRLAPDAKIVIGHGQMDPDELEDVMLRFVRREADILVSTTIIESGIDIATANTMIINDADRFGLSELHQLRGRVGRSKHRAYCYLLTDPSRGIKDTALKRLKAIEQYSMLGAGFKIAMRDLEIRGAGNLLGAEQSGHIAAVGYEMYCRLLEESVKTLNNEPDPPPPSSTSVEIGLGAMIPRGYIASEPRRIEAYRRIAVAADDDQLARARSDLTTAYGEPPRPVERLLRLARLRVAAAALGVRTITVRDKDVVFRCERPEPVAERLRKPARAPAPAAASSTQRALARLRAQPAPAEQRPEHVVALAPKTPGDLAEVYFRPSDPSMPPEALLDLLLARLTPA